MDEIMHDEKEPPLDEVILPGEKIRKYTGCYIPNTILSGESKTDMVAIMLEFHKRTYCDQNGHSILEKLRKIEMIICQIIVDCVDLV